ncbi:MAG: MipA/OmpV family protein [Rubrivivax sp.]
MTIDAKAPVRPLPRAAHHAPMRWAAGAACLAALQGAAWAQPETTDPRWELGVVAVGVSQQAWPGAAARVQRALAVPYAFYRGPVLRVDRDTVGLRAVRTPDFELDVGFSGAFGSNAKDIPARRGMPDLGTLVEFGPRGTWQLGRSGSGSGSDTRWQFALPLRGVFDVDARGQWRGFTLEPELQARHEVPGGWRLTGSASVLLGNARINETIYGVAPVWATAARPAWEGRPGLVAWRLGFSASRPMGPDWRIFGFARLDDVSGAANAGSPLVQQRRGVTAGLGLQWIFLRSSQAGSP